MKALYGIELLSIHHENSNFLWRCFMLFVDNREITDPRTNIALETYLVENRLSDEPLLLFYINEP